ncbi:MAG TPA: DUF2254 domain-containing protein [Pseudolabrys sp.]|nr:DUF2254 domain-containing protein [Pseudolabrys sp.]
MYWGQLQRVKSHIKASLWTVPLIAIPVAMIATQLLHWLDAQREWTLLGFGVSGAQALLQAAATATLSFLVFTFGSLLVAIQVASGQLTPRIIATTLLRDNVVRYTVGLFMLTFLFVLGVENRIDGKVHQLPLFVAATLALACFAAFLYLIDYASRLLRPISILTRVANEGLAVIKSVYPEASLGSDRPKSQRHKLAAPDRVIEHQGTSGIVLAVNIEQLQSEAERAQGVIEFVPQVGDFVAVDEPLFNLYGGAHTVEDDALRSSVAFGSERTMEQDPTFAFRIVIDIALKALSPAINDPTTAVLAIDQLHRLLRSVGTRHLRTDEVLDASGQLRAIVRTPNWEDFVHLAFSEIRACGSSNLQIVRRLRAMIENLNETLPDHRQRELQEQAVLLDHEIDRLFRYPQEQMLARLADSQGLGGHSSRTKPAHKRAGRRA